MPWRLIAAGRRRGRAGAGLKHVGACRKSRRSLGRRLAISLTVGIASGSGERKPPPGSTRVGESVFYDQEYRALHKAVRGPAILMGRLYWLWQDARRRLRSVVHRAAGGSHGPWEDVGAWRILAAFCF